MKLHSVLRIPKGFLERFSFELVLEFLISLPNTQIGGRSLISTCFNMGVEPKNRGI